MVHKVNLDQVYFSICEIEFLLCSTYKLLFCICIELTYSRSYGPRVMVLY